MYPRIYKRNETDFSHNGYGVLKDLIKCEVIEEDNGMFELEGECTISSFLFEYIQEENIIKSHNHYEKSQFHFFHIFLGTL